MVGWFGWFPALVRRLVRPPSSPPETEVETARRRRRGRFPVPTRLVGLVVSDSSFLRFALKGWILGVLGRSRQLLVFLFWERRISWGFCAEKVASGFFGQYL